jgi:hypothetical protein
LARDLDLSSTKPTDSTGHTVLRVGPLCVRWVFPGSAVSALVGRHVVGRDPSCDTELPGDEISRRHAELDWTGSVAIVADLRSRNGVFVNGARCSNSPLRPGDVLRCGEWVGVVAISTSSEPFQEISPGWFGGPTLLEAACPARSVGDDLPIIVEGETGTGKEGMARTVHRWSHRSGPFVAVNCAALPVHLAESELFGHKRGAFTGAEKSTPGLFRAADGGTLFLDEVLELPAILQPKLLRVLEQREVLPLGETTPVPVDVRVVVATQEPLSKAVSEGRFRADLHARLDGLTLALPALRDRREDIVPLWREFLRQRIPETPPELEPKLVEALCTYDWPLNVRELALLARRLASVHGHEPLLRKVHLPERIARRPPDDAGSAPPARPRPSRRPVNDETEFEQLAAALREHSGNVAHAAAAVGISRSRAYRLLSGHPEFSVDDTRDQT